MSRILCIYPQDGSTRFLNRVQNHLTQVLEGTVHCYKIKPNQVSHDNCIKRLREVKEEELILFLGHGRSDRLYGANSYSNVLGDDFYQRMNEYENDNFINKDNVNVFSGKKVFCLSCNSAEGLGKLAIQEGARAFIGFGDIPTDNVILPEIKTKLPLLIARFKGEINWIVKTSLIYSLNNNHNFFQLADTVLLLSNLRINEIILRHQGLRQRRLLADYLYDFVHGMSLCGNGNEKLLG